VPRFLTLLSRSRVGPLSFLLLLFFVHVPSVVAAQQIVGQWKLNEGGGSVAHDSSEKGNVGEIAGAQETPYSVAEQTPGTERFASLNATAPAIQKRNKKKPAKYDVDRIGQRGIGGTVSQQSLERDRRIGASMAREIEAQTKLIADPPLVAYVNRLSQKIADHSDMPMPFTVKVIESDEINAFVLPGGYLYVNSGLIMSTDSEAELASILAHEIAHLAARHGAQLQRRRRIWRLIAHCSGPAGFAAEIAGFLSSMKSTRDAEREADLLGLEYQYAAGYDPQASVQFFEKLQVGEKEKQNFIARALTTHPTTEERIQRAEKEILTLLPAKSEYIVNTGEFETTKSRLAQLSNRRQESAEDPPVLGRRDAEGEQSVPRF